MTLYAVISKLSNSIISYYSSDSGIDLNKPGSDHDQANLVHMIIPKDFLGQAFIKVVPDGSNFKFIIDEDGIQQAIKDQWNNLREERNKKLSASDWTQFPSSPLSSEKQAAWADYRQKLRDLPMNTVDQTNPEWPIPPQ